MNEPVDVRVTNTVQVEKQPVEVYRITFRTVVLTSANQAAELISGPDPQRASLTIIANDAAVVLSGSISDASQADNLTTAIPNPRGGLIPQGQVVPVPGQSGVFASCPLAGNNVNRITVISTHKVAT
jgi:hypothetical protein